MKRSEFFRLRFWHRWLGLIAILPLITAALTGTLLVYKKPLIRLLVTHNAQLPADFSQQGLLTQIDQIETILHQRGAIRAKAPNEQEPYWTITSKNQQHLLLSIDNLTPYQSNLWLLDSYAFVHHLHTKLLLEKTGQWILLVSGSFALVLLISGCVLWWPGRKGFRWKFVKPWPFKLRMVLQFHRHSGVVVFPVLFIITLTGSIMLWQKQVKPLLNPLAMQQLTAEHNAKPVKKSASDALALAQQQIPDGALTYIRFAKGDNGFYRFRFRLPDEWHSNGRTSVNVYAKSNRINVTARSDEVTWQYNLINQLYPLHSGYGINDWYQLFIMFAGLGLAWLSLTGLLSYARQKMR
ncbi:PepSY-associated TM helix domain-containing protein [Neptunicella marina]|uniref:PepSY domain-containing protein n=1 Tax=Neptunicella marina TaxID=2125989 RepID=A0A8J6LVA4_9ALTE|nr:PepSY-associated TM helix domain-containing protein [Neptunicella marina]MBC3764469.1 PepSY domain-containing protein [Neptunicella marina]